MSLHAATAPGTAAAAARRRSRGGAKTRSGKRRSPHPAAADSHRPPPFRGGLAQVEQGGRNAVVARLDALRHARARQRAGPGAPRGRPGAQQRGDLGQHQANISATDAADAANIALRPHRAAVGTLSGRSIQADIQTGRAFASGWERDNGGRQRHQYPDNDHSGVHDVPPFIAAATGAAPMRSASRSTAGPALTAQTVPAAPSRATTSASSHTRLP